MVTNRTVINENLTSIARNYQSNYKLYSLTSLIPILKMPDVIIVHQLYPILRTVMKPTIFTAFFSSGKERPCLFRERLHKLSY